MSGETKDNIISTIALIFVLYAVASMCYTGYSIVGYCRSDTLTPQRGRVDNVVKMSMTKEDACHVQYQKDGVFYNRSFENVKILFTEADGDEEPWFEYYGNLSKKTGRITYDKLIFHVAKSAIHKVAEVPPALVTKGNNIINTASEAKKDK